MFVCGGLTICWIVCCGVVIVLRKLRTCAGRHFAKAPRSNPPAAAGTAAAAAAEPAAAGGRRRLRPAAAAGRAARCLQLLRCTPRSLACSAAVSWKRTRPVTVSRWPPVLSLATIFGTVPSWWTALRTRPARDRRDAGERRDLLRLALREGELRARQEEVVDEVRAGLAELREVGDRRLVRLEHLAAAAEAAAAAARRSPPPLVSACCGASVTVRSVPMLESGLSAVFCARSRPRESDEIAITSATPIESPSTVRIVRLLRRRSSLRRYER